MINTIIIGDKKFNYTVIHKRISSLRLRLKSKKSFIVSCPYFTPKLFINNFIKKNSDWILKHSPKYLAYSKISSLQKINILGTDYQFNINKTSNNSLIIFESEFKIVLNTNSLIETHIKKVFESRLRRFALTLIKKELLSLSKKYNFKFNKVRLRNQSSRFGSCSSLGNLNFNWQIIFFPRELFQHILLHELTHLEIKNHSLKFWNQLTIYDSNCKQNNLWLKEEGVKLFLIKSG